MHALIIGAATYVVTTVQQPRHEEFQSGPPITAKPVVREVKQDPVSERREEGAAAMVQRVMTDTPSIVTMPDMPDNASSPDGLPGATGSGLGGMGSGAELSGAAASQVRTDFVPMFGAKEVQSGGSFSVRLYDLKQFSSRKANPDLRKLGAPKLIRQEVTKFIKGGWSTSHFARFFRAPVTLYPTQIFIPEIFSEEAPKAFEAEQYIEVHPDAGWVALYRGKISPPADGVYRFVGVGDDILVVRVDGRIVLDAGGAKMTDFVTDQPDKPAYAYDYWSNQWNISNRGGFVVGNRMDLKAGHFYDIQVVFSDQGGWCAGMILFQQEGVDYAKDAKGNPILPVFRVADVKPVSARRNGIPVYLKDGPIWLAKPASDE